MFKHHLQMVVSLLFAFSLSACGGGGGSVPGPASPVAGSSLTSQSIAVQDSGTQAVVTRTSSTLASAKNVSAITAPAGITARAIDAGSAATVGAWAADTDASQGWVSSTTSTIDTSRVSNPAPQSVYQSQRAAQSLTYTILNLTPNTAYTVRLHFVESFFQTAKQRLFTITVNSVSAASNFDIFAAAGGRNIAAIREVPTHSDAAGRIVVNLAATVNNASIAGLEIVGAAISPAPSPTPVKNGLSMNVGGSAAGTWIGDADYDGGQISATTATINTSHVNAPPPQTIYQSQRYAANLTYSLPNFSPSEIYTVKLHFAETFFSAAGQRAFNVGINGSQVLSNFDVFQAAGGAKIAVERDFSTKADSTGKIIIAFKATRNNASVAGIEIVAGSGGIVPTPTPIPTVSPSPSPTSAPTASAGAWPAAGWLPYSGGPLTVPVSSNPAYAANSATIVNTLWSGRSNDAGQLQVYSGPPPPSNRDYSPDVLYFGKAADPVYTVTCSQYGGKCSASGVQVHIPRGAYPAGGTDAHIDIRDTVTGKDVMLWEAPVPNGSGGTYSVGWGTVIDSKSEGLNAIGSTASGVSAIWSLRETDLAHNSINHAIVVSINGESPNGYVYPAVGWDNGFFKTNYPPMGAHFWLDVSPSQLPANCPSYAVSYLTALNKYGAYFIVNGFVSSVFGVQAESDMSYTYNGGASVWGPFMSSLGLNSNGMGQLAISSCGINMQAHMHILTPPPHS